MNLDDLRTARFGSLDTAVTKWSEMSTKLKSLADDVRTDLKGKADKANWAGVNASVTRDFIRKTSTEFQEMAGQAKSIHAILSDTASELKSYQKSVNDRISQETNLHVRDNGDGTFTVTPRDDAPDSAEGEAESLKTYLEGVLKKATTSDTSAADVLNSMMELTDMGFSDVNYSDRDSAAKALADAKRAAELAGKNPEDLSEEEFEELVELTGENNGDILFAERFATTLGPEKTLEFWAGINDPRLTHDLQDVRDKYGQLQENLGLTLARATQSDSPAMWDWEYKMTELGGQKVTVDGRPSNAYGFQVMSNLMRWGDFDDSFLDSYGNELIETEKKLSNNGAMSDRAWFDPVMGVGNLNHTGTDTGRDPMIGFMKALSHSPDASTEFFNDPFVTKDEDHHYEDGDGDKRELSVFDYLFEERDWPPEHDKDMDESNEGHNAMGEALEAATTGHPAGAPATPDLPPHNEDQANLMEKIVSSIGEDGNRLTDHSEMSDSMGRIAAEYMPDINRGLSDDTLGNTDLLFPLAGEQANMEHQDITRFLVAVGQDPDGYAAVELGQKNYTANLMDYHLNPDLPEDQRHPGTPKEIIETISRRSGEIGGTLAVGRQEAVLGPAKLADEDFSHAMAQGKNIVSGIVGTGVGVGVTFIASPVGGAVAGGAAATATSVLLDEIVKANEPNALNEAARVAGGKWEDSFEANGYINQRAAELAAGAHSSPHADSVADWALEGSRTGFNDAHTSVEEMADDLETDVN